MKNKLVLFVVGCIFLGLWACMDSDDTEYEVSRDPQIASFSLSNDSISGLSDVVFVIDQLEGLIYNPDSMDFGTEIDEKVLASITFTSYVSSIELYPRATGDTVFWTGSTENDSIDFTKPVDIKTVAMDGLTTKRYVAELNIHTVLPDTMAWNLFQEKTVTGTISEQKVLAFNDGFLKYSKIGNTWDVDYATFDKPKDWQSVSGGLGLPVKVDHIIQMGSLLYAPDFAGNIFMSSTGADWAQLMSPDVRLSSFLGLLDDNTLCATGWVSGETDLRFVTLDSNMNLTKGELVPADFPLEELNRITYGITNTPALLVLGGTRDGEFIPTVWNTNNGLYWEAYQNINFPYRRGAAITKYDDKLYLIGGFDEDGKSSRDIFISQNRGVAWNESGTLVALPEEFVARGFVSVVVDGEQYMYLFGGKATISGNVRDESWKGRINRLGFAK
ncbi:MAG: DUF6242 domain-containing protein [Tannerellaceae bacterium]|nr:DUF6242 domain-containing protein [Tannerellaceae bacterium]